MPEGTESLLEESRGLCQLGFVVEREMEGVHRIADTASEEVHGEMRLIHDR
jgi:hypothetical protein